MHPPFLLALEPVKSRIGEPVHLKDSSHGASPVAGAATETEELVQHVAVGDHVHTAPAEFR